MGEIMTEQIIAYDCKCSSYCGKNDYDGNMVADPYGDYVKREDYVQLRDAAQMALAWLEKNSPAWSAISEIAALRAALSKGAQL
jgi:hypothetical protein